MRNRFLNLFFKNYMVLLTLLVSIELIGHFSYRIYKGKFLYENGRQESLLFKEHPYLIGVPRKNFQLTNKAGDIKISTDHLGNRLSAPKGMKFNEDATQIVCLGGSSTFATGVTDEYSWPYLLQVKLGPDYRVTNLGVPGYTTVEAIIQLSTLPEKYKPDIIINYQGWNDIKNYHLANDQGVYLEHGFLQRTNLKVNRKASLSEYSFIFFIAKKIRSKIISSNNPKKPLPITDGTVDSLYVKNLKTIRALGKYMNAKQIFVPQLMNFKWLKDRHNIENGWTTTIANQDMPQLIQNFNKLMYKTVPSEKDIITLDSIWQVRSWEERHFVDEGHFSKSGGEAFSELLIKSIRQLESQERDSN